MPELHVLMLPSWYPTHLTPLDGIFFKEQFLALRDAGIRVGVIYPEIKSVKKLSWNTLREYRFQSVFTEEDGLLTGRLYGWHLLPRPKVISGRFRVWLTMLLVKQYIARFGYPVLLHAHSILCGGVAAASAGHRYNLPYIVTEHNSAFIEGKVSQRQYIHAQHATTGARRVIAVSSALARYMTEHGLASPAQIRVIPNLVHTDFFTCPVQRPAPQPFRFVTIAFFDGVKRLDFLLKAFARAFKGDHEVVLEIGGDGPQRPILERLVQELELTVQVKFLGLLDRAHVRDAMWRAHTLVNSSFYETFGVTLIEALATGLPVVATACGGPEDIVTPDVGRLIPVDDVDAMADALRWARQAYPSFDPARLREYAVSRFSAPQVTSQIINLYREVLKG
jgi:glycosyltransferase involved in cell wall biosynthesis